MDKGTWQSKAATFVTKEREKLVGYVRRLVDEAADRNGEDILYATLFMPTPLTWFVLDSVLLLATRGHPPGAGGYGCDPFLPLSLQPIVLSSPCLHPCVSPQKRTITVQETGAARNRGPRLQPPRSWPHDGRPFLPCAQQIFPSIPFLEFLSARAFADVLNYRKYVLDLSTPIAGTESMGEIPVTTKAGHLDRSSGNSIKDG